MPKIAIDFAHIDLFLQVFCLNVLVHLFESTNITSLLFYDSLSNSMFLLHDVVFDTMYCFCMHYRHAIS